MRVLDCIHQRFAIRALGWRCVSHYRVVVVLAAMHSGVACRAERDQVLL